MNKTNKGLHAFGKFLITFSNTANLKVKNNKNRLCYFLPWTMPIGRKEEGIILLKGGSLMRCYEFVCPDMDSVSDSFIDYIARGFNNALKHLEGEWAWHVECQRAYTDQYPGCSWSNIAGYLIDKRREEMFTSSTGHFINRYVLSLTYHIKTDIYSKTRNLLYKDSTEKGQGYYNWDTVAKEIDRFRSGCAEAVSYIPGRVAMTPMSNDDVITFLHSTCSTKGGSRRCPDHPAFIDSYITDCDYEGGTCMKLGDYYCPVISVRDFPNSTFPNQFSALTACNIELRWVTRFITIPRDKVHGVLEHYQKRFYGSTKNWAQLAMEATTSVQTDRTDPTATSSQSDAETAMIEESNDEVSFGYYTSCIMVWDKDYDTAMQKASYIEGLINRAGFGAKIETMNAFDAWLSMMPGNTNDNIRRPLVSTGNTACLIPLSSMWQGNRKNDHTEEKFGCGAPLLTCGTRAGTPFFLNLNIRDIGHGFVFGPTGAGKSTLLCLLESQFLKYKGANVIILDKGKSARGITIAAGGNYIEPGSDEVAFQPLAELEKDTDITWCAEFIEQLLFQQHVTANASMREAVVKCLHLMRDTKRVEFRTIGTFCQYVSYQDRATGENTIKAALVPYVTGGQYGKIFDASKTSVRLSKWIMIEMGTLMKMGAAAVTPALMFIFRLIEKVYTKPNGDPTGDPTLLVLDESWVFLDNDYFRRTIEEWLLTLRKKNVFVWFATQEVSKVANSAIATTITSQCKTKIYLADEYAESEIVKSYYRKMDLTDDEITTISQARMKMDYLYKSTLGVRLFQLDLDPFQLALIAPGNAVCDALEAKYGRNSGKPLACEMLDMKGISDYRRYLKAF